MKLQALKKTNWSILTLLLFVGVTACNQDAKLDDTTLAVIENRTIDTEDFVKRYQEFRRRTGEGVFDTFEARRQVLATYVDEEILIRQAEKIGLDDDQQATEERARIEMQQLLNAFTKTKIASDVQVRDHELQRLFVRLNTKVKARHLYAPNREKADSLYHALKNGADFGQVAKTVFQDPKLRNSGGSLGYFTVDEMEPNFEQAAYDLQIGEISKPVRTSDGYSIIMVEDRITKPLLTEQEYAKHKNKLYRYWRSRKIKDAMQAFADSVGRSLEISFSESVLAELFRRLQSDRRPSNTSDKESELLDIEDLENKILVRSRLGVWDVETFRAKARFTSKGQHEWIRNPEHLKEFISGLLVRDMILQEARAAKLDETGKYRERLQEEWDTYLLTRMEQELQSSLVVPKDSLRSYYERDPQLFATPPAINLREIVVGDEKLAADLTDRLARGASFPELAKRYSERRWSAERGGELGFLKPKDLGEWAPRLFALDVGDRTGPLEIDSVFVLLECIEKKPAEIRSFAEARPDVEKTVRHLMWQSYRRARIDEFKRSFDRVKVLSQRLREIRFHEG